VAASATGRGSFVALTDANGKGSVRVVDVDRLETAPLLAAGAPVDVITEPRTLLLAPDTRAVYVAGEGDPAALCGGVAVLATQEEDCKAILDRGPVACPECGDECVVLAVVENYRPGERLTRERLRNDVRCVVPSAETLRDVLWCFECEPGGGGATGPRGERGEPGEQGKPGNDGRGLNPDLPKILDVGWLHKGSVRFDDFGRSLIYDNDPREAVRRDRLPLLTLYFSHEMNDIDRQVLQVEIEYPQTGVVPGGVDNQAATHALGAAGGVAGTTQTFLGIYNIMNLRIYGHIVPVVPGIGTPLLTPHTNERAAWAVAFIPYRQFFSAATRFWLDQAWLGATRLQLDPPCVRVSLLGEFVWTGNHGDEGGILDADNVGGRVGRGPTRAGVPAWIRGGRNPSGNLAQGGVFRSWFFLTRPEKLPDRGPRDDDARRELGLNLLGGIRARAVNLRTATADELRTLDGVDESAAARIVAHRRRNPLNSVSDLLRVEGLGRGVLERNLGRLTVDEGEER
jgi:competence ComEA-like helix-hairpin-helix protein